MRESSDFRIASGGERIIARVMRGSLSVPEAAIEFRCTATMVRKGIKSRVVNTVPGPTGEGRIERAELERVKRECRCSICGALTLGKRHSDGRRYCQAHRGTANAGKSIAAGTRAPGKYRLSEAGRDRKREVLKAIDAEVRADPERHKARLVRRQATRRQRLERQKAELAEGTRDVSEVAAKVGKAPGTVRDLVRLKPRPWAKPARTADLAGRAVDLWTPERLEDFERWLAQHPDGRMQRFTGGAGSRDARKRPRVVSGRHAAEEFSARWCQARRLLDPQLSLEAAMAEVRPTVKAKRSVLRFTAGAPRKGEVHAQWARAYDAIAVWWRGRALDICLPIADEDYAAAPERWEYAPAERPETAKRRVYMAIKRHKARLADDRLGQ